MSSRRCRSVKGFGRATIFCAERYFWTRTHHLSYGPAQWDLPADKGRFSQWSIIVNNATKRLGCGLHLRAARSYWVVGANLRIVMFSIMRRRNGLMASSVMGMLLS